MSDLNELRERIEVAVPCEEYAQTHPDFGDGGYSNAAENAARVLLIAASRDPQAFKAALDAHRENPYSDAVEKCLTPLERHDIMEGRYGLTGFQWGWAVNVVAHLLEQPGTPNGAILTVRSST